MFQFGGSAAINNHNFYQLEMKNLKWEKIYARGDVPKSRDEHTAVIHEDSMVVFGGFVNG